MQVVHGCGRLHCMLPPGIRGPTNSQSPAGNFLIFFEKKIQPTFCSAGEKYGHQVKDDGFQCVGWTRLGQLRRAKKKEKKKLPGCTTLALTKSGSRQHCTSTGLVLDSSGQVSAEL